MKTHVFQQLPDISIQSNQQDDEMPYIQANDSFNPFELLAGSPKKEITFADLLLHQNLPKTAPIAIISHQLNYASIEHQHDCLEILYILKGKAYSILQQTPHLLEAGDLAITPAGTPHLIAPHPDVSEVSQVVNILVRQDLFTTYMTDALPDYHFLTSPPTQVFSGENQVPAQLIQHLIVEYKAAQFQMSMAVLGRLLLLFQLLKDKAKLPVSSYDDLTQSVLDYITSKKGLCHLTEIAQELAYSTAHLSRHIKKQTGQTIAEWIKAAKLIQARSLLIESDLTISQVALEAGYKSESHFFRLFKQEFDLTPKQYQDLMQ